MPLQATSGAASYDAFGGGVAAVPKYIEDYFSTFLYKGNNSTLSINNGIDLSTKGGLVWIKSRSQAGYYHTLVDTVRGPSNQLYSNTTDAQYTATGLDVTAFTSTGFTLGPDNFCNQNNGNNVSWSWAKAPKFFDVVTYTGTGSARTVAHNLGSAPGFIIVKRVTSDGGWWAYHRSLGATKYMSLNTTAAVETASSVWNDTEPTSTVFTVGSFSEVNQSGQTYVAYLFAHDAGGFGLTGTDNVISCGSYTGNGSSDGPTVTLGYEPQWLMVKCSSDPYAWIIVDNMRGMDYTGSPRLFPNLSNAESAMSPGVVPTATGFKINNTNATVNDGAGVTYIYIAIRRGPMKVPTDGTKVFSPVAYSGNSASDRPITAGFPVDFGILQRRVDGGELNLAFSRLTGINYLRTASTAAEVTGASNNIASYTQNGITVGFGTLVNETTQTYIDWNFRRAPGFFDEVCYTGTGYTEVQNLQHNLKAVPEMMIVKGRSYAEDSWIVYHSAIGNTKYLQLNATSNSSTATLWNDTTPTASVFTVGNNTATNMSAATYVAYLFATCPGVSKVGSYTGTGTTQTINCGFTGGARFVLIKRTDSTGDWYVWDSARGIIPSNDPYLLLNNTAAEVTSTDYIDTASTGFEISSTAPAAINASGGTYIFLAIA